MAELTVQEIVIAGLKETFVSAAGGGDTFKNDGRTFFHATTLRLPARHPR